VVSLSGKEATITLLAGGDFVGEGGLAAVSGLRLFTATAINNKSLLIVVLFDQLPEHNAQNPPFLSIA
jgi:CRP-like cAMP-binding protein